MFQVVLSEAQGTFIETWVSEMMVESESRIKSLNAVNILDNIVDNLLQQFNGDLRTQVRIVALTSSYRLGGVGQTRDLFRNFLYFLSQKHPLRHLGYCAPLVSDLFVKVRFSRTNYLQREAILIVYKSQTSAAPDLFL